MGKRGEKGRQVKDDSETASLSSSEEERKLKTPIADANSDDNDDDAEANEDLSLKIVEKAMQRAANGNDVASGSVAMVTPLRKESEKKKKKGNKEKKKSKRQSKETENGSVAGDLDTNFRSFCDGMFMGDDVKEPDSGTSKVSDDIDKLEEKKPVEASDNTVLRRLLRGPRYFDPPDSGWGACYNCGEEGHAAVNCTAPRRKKPCFVCGSLEHNAKQCTKGHDCFICKKEGHRARDCPERNERVSQNSKICLKCGDYGHDMFSCRNGYCSDDLKEVRCYICGSLGHLCCVEYTDTAPRDVSCYRCGLLGHTGLACMGSRGETSGAGSLSSCYRCGEEGHFARECTSSTKVGKRNREWSTPKKKKSKENTDYEVRSVPNDLGKARKKKKIHYDEGFPSDKKSKQRGGWSTLDPGDYEEYDRRFSSDVKSKRRGGWTSEHLGDYRSSNHNSGGWRSPATPNNWRARNYNHGFHSPASSSHYSHSPWRLNYSNPASNESPNYYQHRFSASRFGNSSRDFTGRHYEW